MTEMKKSHRIIMLNLNSDNEDSPVVFGIFISTTRFYLVVF